MATMNPLLAIFATEPAQPQPAATPADGQFGTAHLAALTDALLALGVAIEHASADGLSLMDGIDLMKPAVTAARELRHFQAAKAELLDVTPSEAQQLSERVSLLVGGLGNRHAARIAAALSALTPGFLELITAIRDLRTPPPAPPAV